MPRTSPGLLLGLSAALALLTSAVLIPGAWAIWDAPEALPYLAPERVIVDQSAQRTELQFDSGVLAWIEWRDGRPWVSDGTLVFLDLRDNSSGNLDPAGADALPLSNRTWSPEVSSTHVAWLYSPHPDYRERQVVAMDLQTRQVRVVAAHPNPLMPGHLHLSGSTLAWGIYQWDSDASRGLELRIHRADLAAGTSESWDFPISACKPVDVWPDGAGFLVRLAACDNRSLDGLYAWQPGSQPRLLLGDGEVRAVEGNHVLWGKRSDGSREEGRGGNIHLLDTATGNRSRVSFSPGAEWAPSISGDLVAWAGSESLAGEDRPDEANIYFTNITTRNEYRLAGTHHYTAGPVLDGRQLAFGDADGRLRIATLPGAQDVLVAAVDATLSEVTRTAGDAPEAVLQVDLGAPGIVVQRWDRDLDGDFETEGPLRVEILSGNVPAVPQAFGYAIDTAGRVAAMGVDLAGELADALAAKDAGPDASNDDAAATEAVVEPGESEALASDAGELTEAVLAETGVVEDSVDPDAADETARPAATTTRGIDPPAAAVAAAVAAAGVGVAATVAVAAKAGWLRGLLPFGLFSRLQPNSVLVHPVRQQLSLLVAANPGIHYQEIVRRLVRGRGVVEHHLASLVQAGVVVRRVQGRYTCYFHRDARLHATVEGAFGALKANGAQGILAALGRSQKAGKDLAAELGLSPTTVSYHLQRLAEAGLVSRQHAAGRPAYVITEAGRRMLVARPA